MLKILDGLDTKKSKTSYHLLFIFLLSINYIFPLLVFHEITLFYHDALDIEIVYNQILGKIYRGDLNSIDIFLAGEIKPEYLRRLLQPYTLLYGIFNAELAYWVSDILVKLTAYFSFFILAKKINNNILLCCLISCLFASINLPTHEGFGIAIFPYLIYLMLFKKEIKLKNYFLIIFFGLNSDIVRVVLAIPFIPLILFAINKNIIKENLSNIFKIILVFVFSVIISNSNLIFAQLFDGPFHREEFFKEALSFLDNIGIIISILFELPNGLNWTLFYTLPFTIFLIPLIVLSFFSKDKTVYFLLSFLLLAHLFLFLLNLEVVSSLRYNATGLIKTFNWKYIQTIFPLLYVLIFLYLTKKNIWFTKYLIYTGFLSVILLQINSSLVPITKKYFLGAGNDYKNIYTFRGYYSYDAYKEISKVVKNKRVLSIGLDPMVAVMNNIKTIDGYQTLYPLHYKAKFRKIIENELESNKELQEYYDHWGSRVYAFINDPDNIKIDYEAAKDVGADYIISKFSLNSDGLVLKCIECKNNLYLYQMK